MSKSNTKFLTIDQMIQNRDIESQIVVDNHQAVLAVQRHQFTESKMDIFSDGSGITGCALIAGISVALLMRRRRRTESPVQNMRKRSHSLFSTLRLWTPQIVEFLLNRHSNPPNGGALLIKK